VLPAKSNTVTQNKLTVLNQEKKVEDARTNYRNEFQFTPQASLVQLGPRVRGPSTHVNLFMFLHNVESGLRLSRPVGVPTGARIGDCFMRISRFVSKRDLVEIGRAVE